MVLFTPIECKSESQKDQRRNKMDQRINDKHQRKFSLSLGVNGLFKALGLIHIDQMGKWILLSDGQSATHNAYQILRSQI